MLGALSSIFVIWAIIYYLVYEATFEIINDQVHIDNPDIMLITAFISLACNIFNLIALGHFPCMPGHGNFMDSVTSIYKPHGGHSCSTCSHGHNHGNLGDHDDDAHGHSHSHGHAHSDHEDKDKSHIQSIVSTQSN